MKLRSKSIHIQTEHVPVIHSVLAPAAIAQFVIQNYGLPEDTQCKLIKAGINHTYSIVSGDKRYIFRIYSHGWRSREEIGEELSLLQKLKVEGISVSYPIVDLEDKFIQSLEAPEGQRHGLMFTYAPGQKLQTYDKDTHYEIGKLMAQIHVQTLDMELARTVYDARVLLDQSLVSIGEFLSEDEPEMQFLHSIQPALEALLLRAENEGLRKGIVHLDIWFDNLNISDSNKISLFDFDFCGNGLLCLDLAYYVMQLHNTEKNEAERNIKIDAFYQGYESLTNLSEGEKQVIPALGLCLYFFYLGIQCQRFENWSNTFLNEVYLKRYIAVFIKSYYESVKGHL